MKNPQYLQKNSLNGTRYQTKSKLNRGMYFF